MTYFVQGMIGSDTDTITGVLISP